MITVEHYAEVDRRGVKIALRTRPIRLHGPSPREIHADLLAMVKAASAEDSDW